jgi:uncharacterized protein (DUF302 family)
MKRIILTALGFLLAGPTLAQTAQQPSKEQVQAAMMRQMQMMAIMFDYRKSKLSFDDTVSAISSAAAKHGWSVGQVHELQAPASQAAGASDSKRMKVIPTCPKQANERLAKVSGGKLPPLPCRITVFEAKDGKAYVVRMNTAMLARTLKEEPAKVMNDIASEEFAALKDIFE